jgi:peptide/nickel transport system ATP-binding protein
VANPKENLLAIEDLVIEGQQDAGWSTIVDRVSLTLDRGEVLGLIGESGAGKSTIGIAAMGYARGGCRIASGSIRFDGTELTDKTPEQLRALRGRRISYIAQSAAASFNPAQTLIWQIVETAVVEHGMPTDEATHRAIEMFTRLNLPDPERIGDRYPHELSGGQLQRCMISMAMICRPDLIIFDEPTTALDVTTQIEVLASAREVTRAFNSAAIYITHDLAVVSQVANRIMVLKDGREVESGPTRQIIDRPAREYTRKLLSASSSDNPAGKPDTGTPLLEITNVTAAYGNKLVVLEDITTSVGRGETVALVGESGSGKSTLARVVSGLLPPIEGNVIFDGEELPRSAGKRSNDLLRRMQVIYQMPDTALNPRHRIGKTLGRPLTFYFGMKGDERRQRIGELLKMVELDPSYANRLPGELSGGEKQRVCIARALAAKPDLIICDEVTSALDQIVASEVLELLGRLQASLSVSYLFITHDLNTVKLISDRIVILQNGRIVEQGPKADILAPPFEPYTDLLLSSVPTKDAGWLDSVLEHRKTLAERGLDLIDPSARMTTGGHDA